jgi:hypothetical protein
MFKSLLVGAAASLLLHAQATGPSPESEAALKQRVAAFYQVHVTGHFRQADDYVADDSKDYFFAMEKPRYMSFETPPKNIEYSDNFTKAVVTTVVESEWRNARMGRMVVHPALETYWKLVDGTWYWYHAQPKSVLTPFGKAIMPDPDQVKKEETPNFKKISIFEIVGAVNVNKQNVELNGFEPSSDEIIVTNGMPGQVNIEYAPPTIPGLKVSVDKKQLMAHEQAHITFKYTPPDKSIKPIVDTYLQIMQTAHNIPLRIVFNVPASMIKQLPENVQQVIPHH